MGIGPGKLARGDRRRPHAGACPLLPLSPLRSGTHMSLPTLAPSQPRRRATINSSKLFAVNASSHSRDVCVGGAGRGTGVRACVARSNREGALLSTLAHTQGQLLLAHLTHWQAGAHGRGESYVKDVLASSLGHAATTLDSPPADGLVPCTTDGESGTPWFAFPGTGVVGLAYMMRSHVTEAAFDNIIRDASSTSASVDALLIASPGITLAHIAAAGGNFSMLEALAQHGVDIITPTVEWGRRGERDTVTPIDFVMGTCACSRPSSR